MAARPRLRWDIQNSSPLCRRNIAPPPPKPRGGPQALAGERSEAIRLAVRDHQTRSLGAQSPAQTEQWCCCFGRRRIISGSAENRGSSRPSAIDRPPAQASPLRSYIRPELRFPHAAAQTRIVSVARIRLDSRKSVRPFKGIFCDDISEFESHMPSQPVQSLWAMSRWQNLPSALPCSACCSRMMRNGRPASRRSCRINVLTFSDANRLLSSGTAQGHSPHLSQTGRR